MTRGYQPSAENTAPESKGPRPLFENWVTDATCTTCGGEIYVPPGELLPPCDNCASEDIVALAKLGEHVALMGEHVALMGEYLAAVKVARSRRVALGYLAEMKRHGERVAALVAGFEVFYQDKVA